MTPNPLVRVTLPMLRATYANFPAKAHHTPQNRCLFLAFGVLNHFFWRDWLERHLENPGYCTAPSFWDTGGEPNG